MYSTLLALTCPFPLSSIGNGWIYPRAILAFLKSNLGGVDFRSRRLVAVGHSYGGQALCVQDPPAVEHTLTAGFHIARCIATIVHRPPCCIHHHISSVLADSIQKVFSFTAFILLDPTIGAESPAKDRMYRIVQQYIWNKRDTWPSREAARRELSTQPGFKNWHPEALDMFVVRILSC